MYGPGTLFFFVFSIHAKEWEKKTKSPPVHFIVENSWKTETLRTGGKCSARFVSRAFVWHLCSVFHLVTHRVAQSFGRLRSSEPHHREHLNRLRGRWRRAFRGGFSGLGWWDVDVRVFHVVHEPIHCLLSACVLRCNCGL
jgi:hypothetical protein